MQNGTSFVKYVHFTPVAAVIGRFDFPWGHFLRRGWWVGGNHFLSIFGNFGRNSS
jgi:hypothetical protein